MSQTVELTGRRRRATTATTLLIAVEAIMLAAPVYVLLGEKDIAGSPSLWNIAVGFCRVVTGPFGLFAIVSIVTGRGSESNRDGAFGSLVTGVVLIAAAVAGLGLVIVITGLSGLALLYAGGTVAVGAFRSRRAEAPAPAEAHKFAPVIAETSPHQHHG